MRNYLGATSLYPREYTFKSSPGFVDGILDRTVINRPWVEVT
jgi:hypothetical protein